MVAMAVVVATMAIMEQQETLLVVVEAVQVFNLIQIETEVPVPEE